MWGLGSQWNGRWSALAAALTLTASAVSHAAPPNIPDPLPCDPKKYMEAIEEFKKKEGTQECRMNARAGCNEQPAHDRQRDEHPSTCRSIYGKIQRTMIRYERQILVR